MRKRPEKLFTRGAYATPLAGFVSTFTAPSIFRLIDWMMEVPAELELQFKREAEQIEREMHMPYVTSVERLAKQEGQVEGQAEMLLRVLTRHYRVSVPESVMTQIRATTDVALLERWLDVVFEAATLEEFQQRMQS